MSRHFRPDFYSRATDVTITVPVTGFADLMDPNTGYTVIPARVEIDLTHEEDTPNGDKLYAAVTVIGPRRLKSGEPGRQITSLGWRCAVVEGRHGRVERPKELSEVLERHFPDGWDRSLVDLPDRPQAPGGETHTWREAAALVDQFVQDGEHDPEELVAALQQQAQALEARGR
ncbi:hypothetical protein [Streptomyces pseudogriseolus]|uniref:hypothetical protein n=1 Tax=Streptomyces pseudogriseolus TaxID=36817 RepID=UPI003FA2BA4B